MKHQPDRSMYEASDESWPVPAQRASSNNSTDEPNALSNQRITLQRQVSLLVEDDESQ